MRRCGRCDQTVRQKNLPSSPEYSGHFASCLLAGDRHWLLLSPARHGVLRPQPPATVHRSTALSAPKRPDCAQLQPCPAKQHLDLVRFDQARSGMCQVQSAFPHPRLSQILLGGAVRHATRHEPCSTGTRMYQPSPHFSEIARPRPLRVVEQLLSGALRHSATQVPPNLPTSAGPDFAGRVAHPAVQKESTLAPLICPIADWTARGSASPSLCLAPFDEAARPLPLPCCAQAPEQSLATGAQPAPAGCHLGPGCCTAASPPCRGARPPTGPPGPLASALHAPGQGQPSYPASSVASALAAPPCAARGAGQPRTCIRHHHRTCVRPAGAR